jgi:acetyl/propionyl-CoA carboxylase alpha subunit
MEARRHVSEIRLRTGGHATTVALSADADGFTAVVGDASRRLTDVRAVQSATACGATVEELDLLVDGRPVRALVARLRDRIHVAVDGQVVVFERLDDAAGAGAGGAGSGTVTAPMPGKVVKVLVAVGDAVTAGQPLLVVEAMKMETTLVAEIEGTVATLAAEPGAMVDAGAVLVQIAAPSA